MSTPPPSDTACALLALIELCGPATPYRLKSFAQGSVLHFWSIPHTQIYTECARLASAGLLHETREPDGRRRRIYELTDAGREALRGWRAEADAGMYELRDPGLLKLFAGAEDVGALARGQAARHRERLEHYRALAAADDAAAGDGGTLGVGMRDALEAGIAIEAEYVAFWERIARR